jgi:membrane protein DedA with SNARE-associated domain
MLAVSLHQLIVDYGLLAVFVLVGLESLGVPVPGESILIAAGAYAGLTPHRLNPWAIVGCSAAGAILGDTIGFWIGDKGGYRLIKRFGRYLRFDEPKIKVARYLFARHGGKVVFFGRFVAVLRTYAAFLAGTNKMHYRRFLFFNASGGILWSALYGFGAYFAGSTLQRLSGTLTFIFIGLAVVAFVAAILVVRRKTGELIEHAEAAFPGPLED